ncbi:hypothetical protein [Spirochaeta isovalerica]|uniref:Uncharacterized protein n=1 Tax=Spirochaeta isovalerica TaxID=150 RepID=A0A841R4E4_9SPIO|nr:hypothetical protein [Spirochaeta isovalerica]MBB6478676.1 hypothetical protein [Spirochaeta isovalerica]
MNQYNITLEIKAPVSYYRVHWSPFIRLSKERIRSTVPSEAGIFQVFLNKKGNLDLLGTHQAYYGGLRSIFLEIMDEDCQVSFPDKEKLRSEETYIRYALSSSKDVLRDILHHFTGSESSGRFEEILVEEKETMKVAR